MTRRVPAPTPAPIPAPRASSENGPARRRRHDAPQVPLGSLTQRDARAGATCAECGSTHVTQLSMNLTDGTPVDFTSCHHCEHRTWEHAGSPLAVDSVLDRARKR
jgi:hypothetical protein